MRSHHRINFQSLNQENSPSGGTGGSKPYYTRHKEYCCISWVIDAPIIADPLCHVKHFFSPTQGGCKIKKSGFGVFPLSLISREWTRKHDFARVGKSCKKLLRIA